MLRTFRRKFLPSPYDVMLRRLKKKGGKKILFGWNRGLGDIALGLFPMIERAREIVPGVEITFITRENLRDGFSLVKGIQVFIDPELKREAKWDFFASCKRLKIDPKDFDLVIPLPSPTDWVARLRGKITPKLERSEVSCLNKFDLPDGFTYIGVQAVVETSYGTWRNWPKEKWDELFLRLERMPNVKVLLLGGDEKTALQGKNIIDLRGKTTLFELLAIVQKCSAMILPDSGILSMAYYLNADFPIHIISLWADPNHGILKQAVNSPNKELRHTPLVAMQKDLSTVSASDVMDALFPAKPLNVCMDAEKAPKGTLENVGCIILAGGQGSRFGVQGPKGAFCLNEKSLFEWICEKAPGKNFPIAVMTSEINHKDTLAFFEKNKFFGKEIHFFQQEMEPFYDTKKRPTGFLAPCGNGSVFRSFEKSGLLAFFETRGIDLVTIVPVDNPLGDPADVKLIGYAQENKLDVAVKCIQKGSDQMGSLVVREGILEIQEYIYQDSTAAFANTGLLAISLPFFKKMAHQKLPFHFVKKQMQVGKWGWKKEQFIFDVLPFAKASALLYEKDACFFPIKNKKDAEDFKARLMYL